MFFRDWGFSGFTLQPVLLAMHFLSDLQTLSRPSVFSHSRNPIMKSSSLLMYFWQTKQMIDLLLSFTHTASSSAFNLVSSSLCQNHVFKYSNHNYATVGTINAAFFLLLLLLLCSIYRLSSYIHLFRVALHS